MAKALPKEDQDCFELCIEHLGDQDSAMDFAKEVSEEFGCKVLVNKLTNDGWVANTATVEFFGGPRGR
jgi:hypothetical protein